MEVQRTSSIVQPKQKEDLFSWELFTGFGGTTGGSVETPCKREHR